MKIEDKIRYVIDNTLVLRQPKKLLSTFGSTTIRYFIVAVPMYTDFEGSDPSSETVVREGKITWEVPKLLTPAYIMRMEGFSNEAKKAFEILANENIDLAALLYSLKFKKDSEKLDIVTSSLVSVAEKIEKDIERSKDPYSAIIQGIDEFWDVSLSKFVQELITKSAYYSQIPDMRKKRIIEVGADGYPLMAKDDYGVPIAAKIEIEKLFKLVSNGEVEPLVLKEELYKWDLFELYQDRFFSLFKRRE
jgi:hypothetical protein